MKNIFRWNDNGSIFRWPTEYQLIAPSGKKAATIWAKQDKQATWHTWDQDGVGGENGVDETLQKSFDETWKAVVRQGFHGKGILGKGILSKYASKSIGEKYPCLKPWPTNCFVQCGGHGLVLGGRGSLGKTLTSQDPIKALSEGMAHPDSYETAFFEAFPKEPSTFIRGEGKTIEEAEAEAWAKFEKVSACKSHEFEKRGYKNGGGFCKHCGMFKSKAFEPEEGQS